MATNGKEFKEYLLGTFFGKDIVLKSDEDFDWAKKWKDYIEDIKKQAVRDYNNDQYMNDLL
jgi:hypothetical protein